MRRTDAEQVLLTEYLESKPLILIKDDAIPKDTTERLKYDTLDNVEEGIEEWIEKDL